jgi:hypothetical protein
MATFEEQQPILLKGSCECSAVTYYSTALPTKLRNCHCRSCRKLAAGPYLTFGVFPESSILVDESPFHISPILNTLATGAHRGQCDCGTLLFLKHHGALEDDEVGIVASTIDEGSVHGVLPKPDQHIFVKERASWFDLPNDGTSKHEDYPEDFKESPKAFSRRDTGQTNTTVQKISDALYDPFWRLTDGDFRSLQPVIVTRRLKNLERELEILRSLNWEGSRGQLLEGLLKLERTIRAHQSIWYQEAFDGLKDVEGQETTNPKNLIERGIKALQYQEVPEWRKKSADGPQTSREKWVRRSIDSPRKSGEWTRRSSVDPLKSGELKRGSTDSKEEEQPTEDESPMWTDNPNTEW